MISKFISLFKKNDHIPNRTLSTHSTNQTSSQRLPATTQASNSSHKRTRSPAAELAADSAKRVKVAQTRSQLSVDLFPTPQTSQSPSALFVAHSAPRAAASLPSQGVQNVRADNSLPVLGRANFRPLENLTPKEQCNRGVFYHKQKTPAAYAKAVEWYQKAAEQGNAVAQNSLGNCYEDGQGVEQSFVKAVEWYQKAAEQGYAVAQTTLGFCYYHGHGREKSLEKTVECFQKAAEQGNSGAQTNLGLCYEDGQGVAQSFVKAIEWYQKSAANGDARAQLGLGNCYRTGAGVAQSFVKAVEWYQKAAEQGVVQAQFNLGLCYETGQGVEESREKAVEWYQKAAVQGDSDAQTNLGFCYEKGQGVEQSFVKAVEWYEKAAAQGERCAAAALAHMRSSLPSQRPLAPQPASAVPADLQPQKTPAQLVFEAVKQEKKRIAQQFKKAGVAVGIIAQSTGLSLEEIGRL